LYKNNNSSDDFSLNSSLVVIKGNENLSKTRELIIPELNLKNLENNFNENMINDSFNYKKGYENE
jgi:hypothetical protein